MTISIVISQHQDQHCLGIRIFIFIFIFIFISVVITMNSAIIIVIIIMTSIIISIMTITITFTTIISNTITIESDFIGSHRFLVTLARALEETAA